MPPPATANSHRSSLYVDGAAEDDDQSAAPRRRMKYGSLKDIMARTVEVQLGEEDEDSVQTTAEEEDDDGGDDDEGQSQLTCDQCGSADNGEGILICDKCDRGYHMNCARPIVVRVPTGIWCCSDCSPRIPPRPQLRTLTQPKIKAFFGIQKCTEEPMEKLATTTIESKKRRRRSGLHHHKKKRRLLAYVPAVDESQRLKQMASLASALMALNIRFTPELTYLPGMAPRSANNTRLENGGMQVLSKEDQETLSRIHAMGRRGLCPPLMLVYDSLEGYTVVADGPIKDLTLIAEYAGDVDYLENREHDDCDSLMTLLSAQNPADSLVICPDKHGNIARFINGVNNHKPESKKKQNMKCLRYDVNGESRVLLVATRDIAKGERLYYDYNGQEYEYPTHNFV